MLKKLLLAIAILASPSVVQAQGAVFGDPYRVIAAQAELVKLKKQGMSESKLIQIADAKTDEFCMYAGVLYTKGAVLPIEGQSPLICQQNIHSTGGMNDPLVWVKLDDWNRALYGDSPK